jgi:vesicle-associated membrane protein 72
MKIYRPKLKAQMQYCIDHPEEINKLAKVKAQVSEVKGVMMENIEKARPLKNLLLKRSSLFIELITIFFLSQKSSLLLIIRASLKEVEIVL